MISHPAAAADQPLVDKPQKNNSPAKMFLQSFSEIQHIFTIKKNKQKLEIYFLL